MIPGTADRKCLSTTGQEVIDLQIRDLTQSKIDYLEIMCNFTDDEMTLFRLRAKNVPLEECAEKMNRSIDSIKQLSRRVNAKITQEI